MEFGNIVINETQTPGLDQVTLFNVRIAYIDLEKARQAKGVELNMDPYGPLYTTESGESFFSLKIKSDPNFNQLYFHHSEKEKGDRNCGDITITPTHVFGENVNNMTMYDLLTHIEFIAANGWGARIIRTPHLCAGNRNQEPGRHFFLLICRRGRV